MKNYANAQNVLPQYVLELVHKHFHSGLLWIPPKDTPNLRTEAVIRFLTEGCKPIEIARRVHLSRRRVNQIIRHHKAVLKYAECNSKPEKGSANEKLHRNLYLERNIDHEK